MFNRLDRIPACDRRTDRHTFCHGIVHAVHRRRAVKHQNLILVTHVREAGAVKPYQKTGTINRDENRALSYL